MEQKTNETSKTAVTKLGGLEFKSFSEMKAWGDEIVKSGLTPLKSGGAVVAAVMMGKELGLEPMISVNNIIPINGKATLGIHLINALLLQAGVVTEVIRDYEPCVAFAMKGDDGKSYKGEKGDQAPTVLRVGFADEEARTHEVKGKGIVDYTTVVKMTRSIKQADGTYKAMSVTSSFSYNDSVKAGLHEKDNWAKYMKQMCLHRATAFAGRLIAADITLGMYEVSEMLDAQQIPYVIDSEGKVDIINNDVEKPKSNEVFEEAVVVAEVEDNSNNNTTTEGETK